MDHIRAWPSRALCKGLDPDLFHPERGVDAVISDGTRTITVDQICLRCPVRVECLDYAMGEMQGIWGGWPAEVRSWVRRRDGRECPWCGEPIPRFAKTLMCSLVCLTAAAGSTEAERAALYRRLGETQDAAQLAIAQAKGRRMPLPHTQLELGLELLEAG